MEDKLILEKVKQIEDTPISPQNMTAIAVNTMNMKRPENPVCSTKNESSERLKDIKNLLDKLTGSI